MDLLEAESLFLVGTLVFKQLVAIEDSLYGRIAVILFVSFWNGFQKVSADVCKAAAPLGFLYFVVTLIAIRHQVETRFNSFEELLRIFPCSGRSVIVENDGIKSILSCTDQPKVRFLLSLSPFFF